MKPSPKSDPQRNEVYRWESKMDSLWYDHGMTYRKARALLKAMCKRWKAEPPVLVAKTRSNFTAMGLPSTATAGAIGDVAVWINKSESKPTALAVAHEAAHVVCHTFGVEEPPHGPTWLGVYLDLLDHFKILPRCMTEPSARRAGLKFKRDPQL